MAAPTTTRKSIRQGVIKKLYTPRFPIVSATTGAGSTTSIIDSVLGPAAQTEDYIGAWIYMAEAGAVGGTPAVGEIARVTNFATGTNTLTFAPAMSDMEANLDYELHYKFHPSQVHDKITEIMANLRRPIYLPLTLIADGDMEAAGTTSWSAQNGATLVKETATVLRGRQSLKIAPDGSTANPGAQSAAISIPPGTTLLVSTDVFVTSGQTVKLTLFDVSNAADIETAVSNITGWVHLQFVVQTAGTTEQVRLILAGTSAALSHTLFFNNAILLPVDQNEFTMPSTLEYAEDFSGTFHYRTGPAIPGGGNDLAYRVLAQEPIACPASSIVRDDTAVVHARIVFEDETTIDNPIFVRGKIDYTALTDDTTTTTAPEDIVIDLTYALLMEDWAQEALEDNQFDLYNNRMGKALKVKRELLPRMLQFAPDAGKVIGANRAR